MSSTTGATGAAPHAEFQPGHKEGATGATGAAPHPEFQPGHKEGATGGAAVHSAVAATPAPPPVPSTMPSTATLRAKMSVLHVKSISNGAGEKIMEELSLQAVYGHDGSDNAMWSKFTPFAILNMNVTNSAAFEKVLSGEYYFVDLTKTTKEGE